jgi:tetratricopeptide (TPR) repeat protein
MTILKSGLPAFLGQQSAETLAQWWLEAVQSDPQAAAFLARKMALAEQAISQEQRLRSMISGAATLHEDLDRRDTGKIAAMLEQLLAGLEPLLRPDQADLLWQLCESAIEQIEQTLEHISDPNGDITAVLESIGQLHLQACVLARPDPALLAERLFHFEITFLSETFLDSARTYQAVLGQAGLARFRELAELEWRRMNTLPVHEAAGFDHGRWRITHMMQALAQLSGDLELWVSIKSRDLTSAHHYLEIADMLHGAGQADQALDWAERGLRACAERPDNRLRDFLAQRYQEAGRFAEALELIWVQMEHQPNLEHYRKLADWAMRFEVWPLQRERALQRVAAVIEQEARMVNRWKPQLCAPDQSLMVEIALWENDLDAAQQQAARGAVRRELLLSLAARLAQVQAGQALPVYRRVIDESLRTGGDWGYLDMARLFRTYADLMVQCGLPDELARFFAQVRQQFQSDIALLALLPCQ